MLLAEARRMASIRMSSSMRLSFTGAQVLCTMKQLEPRTLSCRETLVSPSLNLPTAQRPGVSPRQEQMLSAMFLLDPAEKILISLPCKFNADLPPVSKILINAGPESPARRIVRSDSACRISPKKFLSFLLSQQLEQFASENTVAGKNQHNAKDLQKNRRTHKIFLRF